MDEHWPDASEPGRPARDFTTLGRGLEAGSSYPKNHHLQHVIRLAVQRRAFLPGREAEEIRAFWKAAHQKVLLKTIR